MLGRAERVTALEKRRAGNPTAEMLLREVSVILNAYLLAAIPITFVMLAGAWSPLYRQPWTRLASWWSWMALIFVVTAIGTTAAFG